MTEGRWQKLEPAEQLRHIASEVKRAVFYEKSDRELSRAMLERALELVDLTLDDKRWIPNLRQIFILRNLIAESYLGHSLSPGRIYAFL